MSDCLRSVCCCSTSCCHHGSDEDGDTLLGANVVPTTSVCSECQMMCNRRCSHDCFRFWLGRGMILLGGVSLLLGIVASSCGSEDRPAFCYTEPMLLDNQVTVSALSMICGVCGILGGIFMSESRQQNTEER